MNSIEEIIVTFDEKTKKTIEEIDVTSEGTVVTLNEELKYLIEVINKEKLEGNNSVLFGVNNVEPFNELKKIGYSMIPFKMRVDVEEKNGILILF